MRENRTSGSEGGEAQTNELSLPLSFHIIGPRRVLLRCGNYFSFFLRRRVSGLFRLQLYQKVSKPLSLRLDAAP